MGDFPPYFTPDQGSAPAPLSGAPALQVIDFFHLSGPHAPGGDAAVTLDARGDLSLADPLASGGLGPQALREVQAARLAGSARQLDLESVHLFAIQSLAPVADQPGLNDVVLLHGKLFGPFPAAAPTAREGTLAVTRADLLEGFLRGLGTSFRGLPAQEPNAPPRWIPFHLPAADEDDVEVGLGTVLAWPLMGQLPEHGEAGNTGPAMALLEQLLAETKKDPSAQGSSLGELRVPVASRAALETALEARGFLVEGDEALRDRPGLLGSLVPDRARLPKQATLADFAQVAAEVVGGFGHWPSARAKALATRTRLPIAGWAGGEPAGLRLAVDPQWGRFALSAGVITSEPHRRSFSLRAKARMDATWRNLTFLVDRGFGAWSSGQMALEVEFRAEEPGELSADYDHAGTMHLAKGGGPWVPSPQWQTRTLTLENAFLAGHQPYGAGLRLCIKSPGRVEVRRLALRPNTPLPLVRRPRPEERASPPPVLAADQVEPELGGVTHSVGCAYLLSGEFGPSDDSEHPRRSTLELFEDGQPLGPRHQAHRWVRELGSGRYSHWGNVLVFSASDNTDPRTNGRRYSLRKSS